ncbi:MAG: hypothetical protein J6C34_08445 [Oscillospiraceae bacterium]|nr:hypothetical protein [Oscillospiraceae bacterium]
MVKFKIPEGFTEVISVKEGTRNEIDAWNEVNGDLAQTLEEGWAAFLPVGYSSDGKLIEVSRELKITWTNENGETLEETITVATDFGDVVADENPDDNGGEEISLGDRASVQLGIFEEAFQKEISGFRNNGIEGTHIEYHFLIEDVGADELLEVLQSDTEGNPSRNGGFVVKLDAPGEDYSVTGIKIDGENKNVADFVTASGELDGLGWINYVDNGNLCNASKIYSVTWSNGSETVTDNLMVSLVFPQVEENQGGNEPERQPSSNSGENDYPDAVTIEISSALDGVLYEYDPETGAAEFVIAENDPEDWQTAYVDEGAVMSNIYATVIIQAPDWAVGFNGANGGDYFLEEFIERTESEDNEFDPVRNGDPYYRSYIELAHITRNETTGKVTVSLVEENYWIYIAWVGQNGNIVYQSVNLNSSLAEGTTEVFTFDDAFASVQTISPEKFNQRVEIETTGSDLMTYLDSEENVNYVNGNLVLRYTGTEINYESVKRRFINEFGTDNFGEAVLTVYPPAGYKPYKMEFDNGYRYAKDGETTLPVWGTYYGEERIFTDEDYYLYWINEAGTDFIIEKIGVYFDFPFKNIWMEKYWEPLSYGEEDSRLKITVGTSHSTATEYTLEELKEKGAIITIEDGFITVSFADNADIYTITNIIAQVEPPEGAIYYKRNNSGAEGMLDYENAEEQNEIIRSGKIRTIEKDGKPRLDLSGFEVIEINGLKIYVSTVSGTTRVQIIDWYNANDEIIQRDYYYSIGDDYCISKVVDAVEEDDIEKPVQDPTPVKKDGKDWKLTVNHFGQEKSYDNAEAYYFQLEGNENTPEGNKVIYLPYSFIDPELDCDKAVEMELKPKLHHYTDDHSELVEGKPIDGELRPEGIRFVVGSFSPFVLTWGDEAKIGEENYSTLEEALDAATDGDVITLLGDTSENIVMVSDNITLDLNGYVLSANYVSVFGDIVDNSEDNGGRLVVDEKRFMSNIDNPQLPLKTENGYAFVEVEMFSARKYTTSDGITYDVVFEPRFEEAAVEILKNDFDGTGAEIIIRAKWMKDESLRIQDFVFTKALRDTFIDSYNAERGKFGKMLTLKVSNAPEDISYEVVVNSGVGISIISEAKEKTDVIN